MTTLSSSISRVLKLGLAVGACAGVGGCVIETYSDPIVVPRPATMPTVAYVPTFPEIGSSATQGARPATSSTTTLAPGTHAVTTTQPAGPVAIDARTRDQIGQLARDAILRRYPAARDAKLNDYLVLVGSLVGIASSNPNADFDFVLLDTDQPVAGATWPKTLFVSRGLLAKMEDESELAGVLAREITNLESGRALKAIGYLADAPPAASKPTSQPQTRPTTGAGAAKSDGATPASAVLKPTEIVTLTDAGLRQAGQKLADVILKGSMGAEAEQAADLEGARLAAAARYAPDGYLRVLTRIKSGAPNSPEWARIKALDENLPIIAKSHPKSDVTLPHRFQEYVKAARND